LINLERNKDKMDVLDKALVKAGSFAKMSGNDLVLHMNEFQKALKNLETVSRKTARYRGEEEE
jgi:hypothetical protein